MHNLTAGSRLRLPVRRSPHADESLLGYVVRLTELNSYDTPIWILRLANMKSGNMATGAVLFEEDANYEKLADLACTPSEEVKYLGYRATTGKKSIVTCSFLGTSVPRSALNWMYARVCPYCLLDDSYMRSIWDLALATTCPLHRCLLIDRCPKCKQKISSLRKRINYCRCSFDLTTALPLQVDGNQLAITQLSWKLCGLRCEQPDENLTTPLSKMSLEELYDTLELTAKVVSGYDFSSYKKALPITLTNIQIHHLLLETYKAFLNWPIAFESMLDDRLLAESRGTVKVPNAYSSKLIRALVRILTKTRATGHPRRKVGILCTGVGNYICHTNGTIKEHWRLAPYVDTSNTYLTKHGAAKELNLTHKSITELVNSGIIRTKEFPTGKTSQLLIEPASLYEFKKKLERSLTSHEVAKMLSVSRTRIDRLVEYKMLKPICGPGVCEQMDWRFDQDEVDKLINDISSRVPESKILSTKKWLTMSQAVCLSRYKNILMPEILQFIIEGKCTAIRIQGTTGLSGLRVSRDNLNNICLEEANRLAPNHWTINRIAQTLGLKQAAIRHFITSGHLRATKIKWENRHRIESKVPYYCISLEDFEEFKAKFVLPHEVAKKYSLTLRLTSTLLKLSGIMPVCSPKINLSGLYLFRRAEVDAIGSSFMSSADAKRRIWLTRRYYKKCNKAA